MKKYGRAVRDLLLIGVLSAAYLAAAFYTARLDDCGRFALILEEQHPLTAKRAAQMRALEAEQETSWEFAAWAQKNGAAAENADLKRSRAVCAVTVWGRSDIVLRGTARLDAGDTRGCLIDAQTALRLFGSRNVTGQTLLLDGEEKTVRGLLYGVSDTVLTEAAMDAGELPYLTVLLKERDGYESVRQDFMARHGLQGAFVRMDILSRLAGFLCLRIRIPKDMIPTRWSDFTFWRSWWESERESLLRLLLAEKQKPMQAYLENFSRAAACGLLFWTAAALLLFRARRFFSPKRRQDME